MFEKYLSPTVLRPPGGVPVVTMVQYYKPICPTALKLLPGGAQCLYREGYVCVQSGCIGAAEWLRDRPRYRLIRSGFSAARVLACSEWLARELVASGIDAEPLHLPVPAVSFCVARAVPEIVGGDVFSGACFAAMTTVGWDSASAAPALFVAVTETRSA